DKDLTRDDMAGVVEDAFKVGKIVLASSTYDASLFPPMHYFLYKLSIKGFKRRRFGIIENGTWAPMAAKHIKAMLEPMKEIEIVEPVVSLKSALRSTDAPQMQALAEAMLA
ncbi:MAG: FprA family A-type flavoprotein, partial [Bacteroidales bacterium]|nr:FprA family A-type flavoprotein [Bacteroidales bacterium]